MKEADILFSNCTLVKDHLFFVDTQSGLPAMMSPITGVVTYCDQFQDFIWRGGNSIDFMGELDGKVYALETAGDYLVIFDFQKQQCKYIPLECNKYEWGNFVAFEKYGSDFFIFPKSGNNIIIFNAKCEKIVETIDMPIEMGEIQCACREENRVYLLSQDGNTIQAYNLAENNRSMYKLNTAIKDDFDGFDSIVINGSLFFLNMFGIVYKWNVGDGEAQRINTLETRHLNTETVCRIVSCGYKLIVLPSSGSDIKILDLINGEKDVYHKYPSDFMYYDIEWSKYDGYCEDEIYYYFAMRRANYFLKIRKADGEFTWIKPKIFNTETRDTLGGGYSIQRFLAAGTKFYNEKVGYLYGWLKYMPINNNINCDKTDIGGKIYDEWRRNE